MKCLECVLEGERSTVTPGSTETTLLSHNTYYDEDGVYHDHDPNRHTTPYRCSRGHNWLKTGYKTCPNCGYNRDPLAEAKAKHPSSYRG